MCKKELKDHTQNGNKKKNVGIWNRIFQINEIIKLKVFSDYNTLFLFENFKYL